MFFPKYPSHEAVRCFRCDVPLQSPPLDDGYGAKNGQWKQRCRHCNMFTYYDLED